jgi:hypothetical protein
MHTKCPQKTITFKDRDGLEVFQELNRRKRYEHLNISAFAVQAFAEKLAREIREDPESVTSFHKTPSDPI